MSKSPVMDALSNGGATSGELYVQGAKFEADLAAAQSEAEALREWQVRKNDEVAAIIAQRDEALIAESKALADLAAAQTRADAMLRVAERYEAEAAALKADAERYRWLRDTATSYQWQRALDCPPGYTDFKIDEMMFAAIDAAKESGNG